MHQQNRDEYRNTIKDLKDYNCSDDDESVYYYTSNTSDDNEDQ